MKHFMNRRIPAALLCLSGLLLESCVLFPAKQVALTPRSSQESQNYYQFSAGGANDLSFESRNFL